MAESRPTLSPWSPLQHSVFRAIWLATVVSNLGTWIQSVGAAWLMTLLSPSALMVALIQTATSLPVFLLSFPAGALADVVNRRKLLLLTQTWMLVMAAALALVTWFGLMTPTALLLLTFFLGLGAALNGPAWQAIVPELVSTAELPAAVSLGSVAFNIARAVGPAIGGLVIAASGPAATFALNAVSFVGVIFVLYRWKSTEPQSALPAERVWGAMKAGVRYLRHSPSLQTVLIRAGVFIFFGSALWALLPLRTRNELNLGAAAYGILLGCLGAGALIGASALPKFRRKLSSDTLTSGAALAFGAATAALALFNSFPLLCLAMLLGGFAWLAILSTFNVAAVMGAPAWVKSRALGVYMLIFNGGLAVGSAAWGALANRASLRTALLISAAGLAVGIVAAARYSLNQIAKANLEPSRHWPDPTVGHEFDREQGPVAVTVEYEIDPAKADKFTAAVRNLRAERLRDGALAWHLLVDIANPARRIEYFVVESWLEHLRQHERVTLADKELQDQVNAFHIGQEPPRVSHFLFQDSPETPTVGHDKTV
jgi:MFS family permease